MLYYYMGKYDARKLAKNGLEQLRKQAIQIRKKGLILTAIAEILGVRCATVSVWWKLYQAEGSKAFKSKDQLDKIKVFYKSDQLKKQCHCTYA